MTEVGHLVVNCVVNAFLSYTTIILNITTIYALRKTSSLPKPLKTLLLSLTVSDVCVGLLVQPLCFADLVMELQEKTESNRTHVNMHKASFIAAMFFCSASFFGVTALSADRFLGIHLHLRYQELVTNRRVVAVVISFWVFSAFIFALYFDQFVRLWKIAAIIQGIIATVCLISSAFFYYKIYVAVRLHRNHDEVLQVQQEAQNGEVAANNARQRKSAVATFYVYLVFLACYLPYVCTVVVYSISGESNLLKTLNKYTMTLVFLNSTLNPLIYCWTMRHIRHAIMDIMRNTFQDKTKQIS